MTKYCLQKLGSTNEKYTVYISGIYDASIFGILYSKYQLNFRHKFGFQSSLNISLISRNFNKRERNLQGMLIRRRIGLHKNFYFLFVLRKYYYCDKCFRVSYNYASLLTKNQISENVTCRMMLRVSYTT